MICNMLLIAGAMQSPQATYYAETCYLKSLTYPIQVEACIETFPERKDEFDQRLLAWRNKYTPMFEKSREYLQSKQYDFSRGAVPFHTKAARSWAKGDQDQGRAHMEEMCNAHLADLNS
mgnify:CR=1 FL=1|jgi:hypothetical protein